LIGALLLFAHQSVLAAPAKYLTITDVVMLALRYNPNVQASELQRVVDKYNLRVAENEFELQYALMASYRQSQTRADSKTSRSTSTNITSSVSRLLPLGTQLNLSVVHPTTSAAYNPQAMVSLSQPLLRGFGPKVTKTNLNNAFDSEKINKLSLKGSVIDAITAVINDYRAFIESNNNLVTLQLSLTDAKRTLKNNRAKIRAGVLAPTDEVQAKVSVAQFQLAVTQAKNNIYLSRQNLLNEIGLDPNLNVKVPKDVAIKKLIVPKLEESIDKALINSIDYQIALIGLEITRRGLTVAKNEQLWRLDLDASATFGGGVDTGSDSLFSGKDRSHTVGLILDVPINDLPRKQQLVSTKIALEQQEIRVAQLRRDLITRVKNDTNEIKTQVEQIKNAQISARLSKRSYDIEKKKQVLGRATALDVTDTRNAYTNARLAVTISTRPNG